MTTLGSLRTFVFTLAMGSAAVSQTRLDLQRQTNANIHQDSSTGHISATKGFSTPLTAVSFSPTPAFDAGAANVFTLVLSGDVTGSTLTNAQSGQVLVYRICQNTAGSHSFSWPANFRGGGPVSTAPSACSQQTFVYDGSYANALGAVLITGLPGGSVTLPGTTSGSTSLQPAAIASGTLTLPAATDTLVGQNTIDTLQNKTINGTSNFLFPTAQQTIAGFSGCGGGKFLKDDGTCTAASVSGSSTSTLDPSLASFQDDFPPVSVVAPYIGEWRWGGNCAAGDQDSSRDNPGIIRFSNQGATGSTCVVRPWAGGNSGWASALNTIRSGGSWSYLNILRFPTVDTAGTLYGCLSGGDTEGVNEVCWKFAKGTSDSIVLHTCFANTCSDATNVNPISIIENTFYSIRLFMTGAGTVNMEVKAGGAIQTASTTQNLPNGQLIPFLYINEPGHQIDMDLAAFTISGLTRY